MKRNTDIKPCQAEMSFISSVIQSQDTPFCVPTADELVFLIIIYYL